MPSCLFFLTIGDDDEMHHQAFLAVLTCLGHLGDQATRIVMCTDRPERYQWFGDRIECMVPSADELKAWRGNYDLFSRIKIEALSKLVAADGPQDFLVLDSDILATQDLRPLLASIADGQLYMHKIEYPWAKGASPRVKRVWKHLSGKTYAGYLICPEIRMWNAGVQGVPASRCEEVLTKELELYDAFSDDGLYKLRHTTQQHTISLVMQRAGELKPSDDWFRHYWANKHGHMKAVRRVLCDIMTRGMDATAASHYAIEHPIVLPEAVRIHRWQQFLAKFIPEGA
ncbi:MAG: hypothetical protein PF961_06000 [Planctomycetota bacterium]|nr:hypothetical protein [Planctomycetota bacterium]